MAEKKSTPLTAPPVERRKIIDPLGEIERVARDLFQSDLVQPPELRRGTCWEDYWGDAEAQLVGGRSGGAPSERTIQRHGAVDISPDFAQIVSHTTDRFLATLASGLKQPLTEHESECLGHVLRHTVFTTDHGESFGPCDVAQAGELLGELAGEYDEEFLRSHGRPEIRQIPPAVRADYWRKRIEAMAELDEPLTFNQQNTIMRLRTAILGSGEFVSADPSEKSP